MKTTKIIKLIFTIAVSIFIILVGVVGIYEKKNAIYQSLLPNYAFAPDLKGSIELEFDVDTTTNTVYYDEEGNKVDSDTVTDENKGKYTAKEEAVNAAEVLTETNYQKTVNILEQRCFTVLSLNK